MADLTAQAHALHARACTRSHADHPDQPKCIGADTQDPVRRPARQAPHRRMGNVGGHVTPQQIDLAWSKYNGLANIAIACGPSGIVVLDEDQAAELDKWCTAYGVTLPPTHEVSTGRGRHLYYYWDHSGQPIGNGSKAFDKFKIDVRGKGGMVIAEGSKHASGVDYIGNGKPIAALPQKVADKIIAGQTTPTQQSGTRRGPRQPERHDDPAGETAQKTDRLRGSTPQESQRLRRGRDPVPRTLGVVRATRRRDPRGQVPHPTCTYAFTWAEARVKLVDAYNRWPLGPKPKKAKKAKKAAAGHHDTGGPGRGHHDVVRRPV